MNACFLDTGYLIALEASDDQHHHAVQDHWKAFLTSHPRLITTTYVFDELVTFFNSRDRHAKAVEIGRRLLQSPSIQLVHVESDLFEQGWRLLQERADKRYSLTDCISFVVMEHNGIRQALTFDGHFRQEGFQMLPSASS